MQKKTLYWGAPFALASHENGVAQFVSSRVELPVCDSRGKFDGILVDGNCLISVQDVVGLRVKIHLENIVNKS
jgi:hypothetical protein